MASPKILETFPNPALQRDYTIEHTHHEFTSVCPMTGHPDFAAITVRYVAGKKCVELGAQLVILLPYFLSAGVHVQRDLAEACRRLTEQHAGVDFRLAEPLGRHPLLLDVVLERCSEAVSQQ